MSSGMVESGKQKIVESLCLVAEAGWRDNYLVYILRWRDLMHEKGTQIVSLDQM